MRKNIECALLECRRGLTNNYVYIIHETEKFGNYDDITDGVYLFWFLSLFYVF